MQNESFEEGFSSATEHVGVVTHAPSLSSIVPLLHRVVLPSCAHVCAHACERVRSCSCAYECVRMHVCASVRVRLCPCAHAMRELLCVRLQVRGRRASARRCALWNPEERRSVGAAGIPRWSMASINVPSSSLRTAEPTHADRCFLPV